MGGWTGGAAHQAMASAQHHETVVTLLLVSSSFSANKSLGRAA